MMITELSKQQVQELYALRTVLEGTAAGMAAQHASPSELADMRDMIIDMTIVPEQFEPGCIEHIAISMRSPRTTGGKHATRLYIDNVRDFVIKRSLCF